MKTHDYEVGDSFLVAEESPLIYMAPKNHVALTAIFSLVTKNQFTKNLIIKYAQKTIQLDNVCDPWTSFRRTAWGPHSPDIEEHLFGLAQCDIIRINDFGSKEIIYINDSLFFYNTNEIFFKKYKRASKILERVYGISNGQRAKKSSK